MSDVTSEFLPAKDSLGWANDAISEMQTICAAFFNGDIAEIVTDFDPDTGENVQKLRLKQGLPNSLGRKATEALVNTRHAFDQATFAARNLTSGRSAKSIYFPWASSPIDLEHLLKSRGIDERLRDIFRKHEPYKRSDEYSGGDDIIRSLASLANDKHTVGLAVGGYIQSARIPSISGQNVNHLSTVVPKWDPVKNEAELIRWNGDVQVNGEYQFGFEVIFKDTASTQSVNAPSALYAFSEKAKTVIEDLETRCFEIFS